MGALVTAAALVIGLYFIYPLLTGGAGDEPQFVVALGARYFSDQGTREELAALRLAGLPAYGRLSRLDENGTWTRIFLGPFDSRSEAGDAAELARDEGLAQEPLEVRAEPPPTGTEQTSGQVVAELSALLDDAQVLDELVHPQNFNIYALARTAVVTDDGEALNLIYLGPFADEEEAVRVLDGLEYWPLASAYVLRRLDN